MSSERTPKNLGLSYDRGLALEKRAIANDPSCVECLATSAELLAGKGLMREALDTANLALALVPGLRLKMTSAPAGGIN